MYRDFKLAEMLSDIAQMSCLSSLSTSPIFPLQRRRTHESRQRLAPMRLASTLTPIPAVTDGSWQLSGESPGWRISSLSSESLAYLDFRGFRPCGAALESALIL